MRLHRVWKKHPEPYWLSFEEGISNFNNCWYNNFWRNWPSNDRSVFHLTQCLLLHYLGKTEPTKYEFKWTEIRQKSISNIVDCDLKNYQHDLIIFGANIFNTTCHQMTVLVPTSPNVCFRTTWENPNWQNRIEMQYFVGFVVQKCRSRQCVR